jgi:hypothetical protein
MRPMMVVEAYRKVRLRMGIWSLSPSGLVTFGRDSPPEQAYLGNSRPPGRPIGRLSVQSWLGLNLVVQRPAI